VVAFKVTYNKAINIRQQAACKHREKMYEVDKKDKVITLNDIPQSSIGAPIPIVLAGEHDVLVTYYLQNTPKNWDGTTVKVISNETVDEPVAILKFSLCLAHMFGPPNDEAFSGHPLSDRGLEPYSAFKIENSSWLRKLEKMNSVHPYHNKERYLQDRNHYILSFHDSTFECIAQSYEISTSVGSVSSMIPSMVEQLR